MDLYSVYSDKSKDYTTSKIIQFSNKLSPKDHFLIKLSLICIPILLLFVFQYFIASRTILIIVGVFLFSIISLIYSMFILFEILSKDTGKLFE